MKNTPRLGQTFIQVNSTPMTFLVLPRYQKTKNPKSENENRISFGTLSQRSNRGHRFTENLRATKSSKPNTKQIEKLICRTGIKRGKSIAGNERDDTVGSEGKRRRLGLVVSVACFNFQSNKTTLCAYVS